MQDLLALLLLIFTSVNALLLAAAACPQGWHNWRYSCYITLKQRLTWFEAVTACQRPGGGLIVENTPEEQEFIIALRNMKFNTSQSKALGLWIGCEFRNQELKCLGGRNATDVMANSEEQFAKLLAKNDRKGDCLSKRGGKRGTLAFSDCSSRKFVMCEMPEPRGVPAYCASLGTDGRVVRRCLHGHEIKNLTVQGVLECGQACWAEPRCRSFNLWQGGPAKTCQLNDASSNEVSSVDFSEQGQCVHFEL